MSNIVEYKEFTKRKEKREEHEGELALMKLMKDRYCPILEEMLGEDDLAYPESAHAFADLPEVLEEEAPKTLEEIRASYLQSVTHDNDPLLRDEATKEVWHLMPQADKELVMAISSELIQSNQLTRGLSPTEQKEYAALIDYFMQSKKPISVANISRRKALVSLALSYEEMALEIPVSKEIIYSIPEVKEQDEETIKANQNHP